MNPYDDWAKNNPKLMNALNNYYAENKHRLNENLFANECDALMQNAPIMEKCKVLTILSALKAFADSGK